MRNNPLCLFFLFFLSLFSSGLTDEASKGYQIIADKANLTILNPSLAERKSIKLRLANGLEAYLISDPKADQSAAALSVEAGSWNDPKEYPKEYPGMAHFLEHMLFMGTATYPKEFEYMQYITDHGGVVNASTWPDHTVYMFSINNEAFSEALDRFSHFFIDPLFSPSCIDRELHAVDQEHAKNIENDEWRNYMIFKETGNPLHPNASFSTGNAKTLSGIPQKALKEWYKENYSANKMHLFAISPLSLEEMIALVTEDFGPIVDHQRSIIPNSENLSSPKQLGHMIYIKPIKELRQLSFVWEIPKNLAKDQERKAPELIAYALQADTENSLIEVLKKEKIAEKIDVSIDRMSRDEMLFRIDLTLTTQGVSQIDTAITRVFQAINQLKQKKFPSYLFEEKKRLAQFDYEYQSREEAFEYAMRNANAMLYENIETYPRKTLIPSRFDPEFIFNFLNTLQPQTCIFFVNADPKLTHISPTISEKWMGAEYAIKEVPSSKLLAWSRAENHPHIELPPANPFMPTDLTLLEADVDFSSPQLLIDDVSAKIYACQDNRYLVPEISALFHLKSPLIDGSAKKTALLDLYLKALEEALSSTIFFADHAGLHPQFSQRKLKMTIDIQGYSQKAPLLVKEIFQQLKMAPPSADEFELYKQSLLSDYDNVSKELPVFQAKELLASVLFNDSPMSQDKYKALKTVTYEEFLQFSGQLFKKAYLEGFLYGNLNPEQSEALALSIKEALASLPYPKEEQLKRELLVLPQNHEGPYLLIQKTPRQGNGVVLLLEEGAFTFEKRAAQQLLGKALKEAFFDTLRTKQQTAYFVRAWDTEEELQLLQFFAVQSSTHNPRDLIARFELFLEDFLKNFSETLPEERFESLRDMLIVTLQRPPENLDKMGQRLFLLAFEYDGDFDRFEKRIQSVKEITYEQLQKGAIDYLSRENARRLAVLIQGIISPENAFNYHEVTTEQIRGIGTYTQVN
jgi:insulysin